MNGIPPLRPVQQISVRMGVDVVPQGGAGDGKNLVESALNALKEVSHEDAKQLQHYDEKKLSAMAVSDYIDLSETIRSRQLKIQLINRFSSEAASGFKTLTQSS